MKLALVGGLSFSQDYVNLLKRYESDRIRLLDYVFGESLEELWRNAYCVVQPSTMEGLSIALLEALSYGRCALASGDSYPAPAWVPDTAGRRWKGWLKPPQTASSSRSRSLRITKTVCVCFVSATPRPLYRWCAVAEAAIS